MATWSISVRSIGTSWHEDGENPLLWSSATVLALVRRRAPRRLEPRRQAQRVAVHRPVGPVRRRRRDRRRWCSPSPAASRRPRWGYAAVTGLIHVPYLAGLALAYDRGDFSLAYPIARGGGALLAGIGGIVLLGDDLDGWSITAIVTVVAGMMLLAAGAAVDQVATALFVAVTIGAYTINDSHAVPRARRQPLPVRRVHRLRRVRLGVRDGHGSRPVSCAAALPDRLARVHAHRRRWRS